MGKCPHEQLAACRNKSPRELRFVVSDLFIDEVNIYYHLAPCLDASGTNLSMILFMSISEVLPFSLAALSPVARISTLTWTSRS